MTNFSKIDSVRSVATKIDYFNPALHGNVMWLNSETLGAYESFLWKFRTILSRDELQNWIIQNWHHRAHLSPISSMIKVWDNVYFYRSIKWSGFSNPHEYLSKKDDNWTIASDTQYKWDNVPEIVMKEITKEYDWWYEVMWCFDDRVFGKLSRRSEDLNNSCARVEMITKSWLLEEVVYNWEIVSISELKQRWIIPNVPELKLRQFERLTRSRFRIKDFCDLEWEEKLDALKETLSLLNKEKSETWDDTRYSLDDLETSTIEYLLETTRNLAKNLAIFFSKWYTMWYMNSWNITLWAWEIVDLDSLRELWEIYKPENVNLWINVKHYQNTKLPLEVVKDIRDITYALNLLIKSMKSFTRITTNLRQEIATAFLESFTRNYNHSRRLDNFYEKNDLLNTLNFYVTETLEKWIWQSMIK